MHLHPILLPPSSARRWGCSSALGWTCLGTDHWNGSACQAGKGWVQPEFLHWSSYFVFRRFIGYFVCSEPKTTGICTCAGMDREKNIACACLEKMTCCKQLGISVFRDQLRWCHRKVED